MHAERTQTLDELRARLEQVGALKTRAGAQLIGPPSEETRQAVLVMDLCDREWDRVRREIRNHPDYVLEGL